MRFKTSKETTLQGKKTFNLFVLQGTPSPSLFFLVFSCESLPNDNKISDNKIRKISKLYCHGSSRKNSVFGQFSVNFPSPTPFQNANFVNIVVSASLCFSYESWLALLNLEPWALALFPAVSSHVPPGKPAPHFSTRTWTFQQESSFLSRTAHLSAGNAF